MKRIFIISGYAMFGRGLESLLKQEDSELEIVGQESDVERAIEQIKELKPDTVILDSDDPPYDSMPAVLRRILKDNLGIRIIGLSLQNNRLYVYVATQWVVNSVGDLLNAIFDDTPSSASDNWQAAG